MIAFLRKSSYSSWWVARYCSIFAVLSVLVSCSASHLGLHSRLTCTTDRQGVSSMAEQRASRR